MNVIETLRESIETADWTKICHLYSWLSGEDINPPTVRTDRNEVIEQLLNLLNKLKEDPGSVPSVRLSETGLNQALNDIAEDEETEITEDFIEEIESITDHDTLKAIDQANQLKDVSSGGGTVSAKGIVPTIITGPTSQSLQEKSRVIARKSEANNIKRSPYKAPTKICSHCGKETALTRVIKTSYGAGKPKTTYSCLQCGGEVVS